MKEVTLPAGAALACGTGWRDLHHWHVASSFLLGIGIASDDDVMLLRCRFVSM